MPSILKRTVMTALGTARPVEGDANEFVQVPSQIEVGIVASATGVLASVYSGSDQIADEVAVPVATINTMPKYPDDFFAVDGAMAGDRLRVVLRETANAATTVMTAIRVTPL